MPRAADFRKMAREAFAGMRGKVFMVALVAILLGGIAGELSVSYNIQDYSSSYSYGYGYGYALGVRGFLLTLYGLFVLIFGGVVQLGYNQYNIKLQRREVTSINDLFSRMSIFGKALGLRLFCALFIALWSMIGVLPAVILISVGAGGALFGGMFSAAYFTAGMVLSLVFGYIVFLGGIVLGIIARYRYAMATYLMSEYPHLGVREAVNISKQMMKGHKGRLFCLHFSFIGWALLFSLPATILLSLAHFSGFFAFLTILAAIAGSAAIAAYLYNAEAAFFLNLNYHFQNAYGAIRPSVYSQNYAGGGSYQAAPGVAPQPYVPTQQNAPQPSPQQPVAPGQPGAQYMPPQPINPQQTSQQDAAAVPPGEVSGFAPMGGQPLEQTADAAPAATPQPTAAPSAETPAPSAGTPAPQEQQGSYYDHARQRYVRKDDADQ